MIKEIQKFDKDDLIKLKMLDKILSKAIYELEGNAVMEAASLFSWFGTLGAKMDGALKIQILAEDKEPEKKPSKPMKNIKTGKI